MGYWALPVRMTATPDPREAAQKIIRDLDLQSALPRGDAEVEPPFRFDFHLSPLSVELLFWTLIAIAAAVILWTLRDRLPWTSRDSRRPAPAPAPQAPAARRLDEAQTQADALAADGRFVEAMHVLLLRALNEMRNRLGFAFRDSATSREILRSAPLQDRGRGAFAAIVASVERVYFGGAGASDADYADCRANFEAFKDTLNPDPQP